MSHVKLTAVDHDHHPQGNHSNSGRHLTIRPSGYFYPATRAGLIGRTVCDWRARRARRARRAAVRPTINTVAVSITAGLDPDTLDLLEMHEQSGNFLPQCLAPDAILHFELATYRGPWPPLAARIEAALAAIEREIFAPVAGTRTLYLRRLAPADAVPLDDAARARVATLRARRIALGILQREITAEAGIVRHLLARLEQGHNVTIRADTLDRLESALDRLAAAGAGGPN